MLALVSVLVNVDWLRSELPFPISKGRAADTSQPNYNVLCNLYLVNAVAFPSRAQVHLVTGLRRACHLSQLLSMRLENELENIRPENDQ